MLVSLFSKGYRVIFFTSLFDLFVLDAKIETICKVKRCKKMIEEGGMKKKGIFLALLLMVLASLVASGCVKAEDEPVETTRPEWKVGDQWKLTVREPGGKESFLLTRVAKIEDFKGVPCYLPELVQGNRPDKEQYFSFQSLPDPPD